MVRFLALLCFLISLSSNAGEIYAFESDQQQLYFQSLIAQYRCPVCAGQGLDDSNAPAARAIKDVIYEQVKEGRTKEDIDVYLESRYGDAIHFMPSSNGILFGLMFIPAFFMLICTMALLRRRNLSMKLPT